MLSKKSLHIVRHHEEDLNIDTLIGNVSQSPPGCHPRPFSWCAFHRLQHIKHRNQLRLWISGHKLQHLLPTMAKLLSKWPSYGGSLDDRAIAGQAAVLLHRWPNQPSQRDLQLRN